MIRTAFGSFCILGLFASLLAAGPVRAGPVEVIRVTKQQALDATYFRVVLKEPASLALPKIERNATAVPLELQRRLHARLPALVPLDAAAADVHFDFFFGRRDGPADPVFLGKVRKGGTAKFLFVYPIEKKPSKDAAPTLAPQFDRLGWEEEVITVDFDKAVEEKRGGYLRTAWAEARAHHFAHLEAQAPDFGFYGFARQAMMRKYDVFVHPGNVPPDAPREQEHRRLYEQTTGATALAESLALRRLLANNRDTGERLLRVDRLRGIAIAEHPWRKMIGDKKPADEPLARMIPHDNYYLTFKSMRSFVEFAELIDQWGTNISRGFEISSRDDRLKQRYEKQLCLRSTGLAKTLGPALIRDVAITGSDPFLREGTDVTVIFNVKDARLFLGAVSGFIDEARKEHGGDLKELTTTYKDETIESFTTPLREVSLHRTTVGSYVIYANSLIGLQRVLDARAGRRKNLAESLDFQYMRTVFNRDDKAEDGFAFLSDAFLRELVGPQSKIKEKRRLEALASLTLVTHGALFTAWETGKLPADHKTLMKESWLKDAEIYTPEGDGVIWDGKKQRAVSEAYNTLRFLTPLIELPIDKVTQQEANDYEEFRRAYLDLWRQYFDPVGMRVSLSDTRVKLETYILPLIQSGDYASLREWTGDGTATLDVNTLAPKALFQYMTHIAPAHRGEPFLGFPMNALGNWMLLRLDDGPAYRRLAECWVRQELEVFNTSEVEREMVRDFFELPLTVGFKVGDPRIFSDALRGFGNLVHQVVGPVQIETLKPDYKGVKITRVAFGRNSKLAAELNMPTTPEAQRFAPTYWHAQVDGAWYLSMSETALREQIDRSVARRDGKGPAKGESAEINSSLYFAPEAAFRAQDTLQAFLEWESHKRAVANGPYWYALIQSGVLAPAASKEAYDAAALKYLSFIPVSPDEAPYEYDRRIGEVRNVRHGSLARPTLQDRLRDDSALQQLLTQFRTVRADLRFREDGVHTTVTIERKKEVK